MAWDPYPEIRERFERETAKHELTVLHDDGLYRHLRWRRPDRNAYWFDLITWPGCLTFRGDFTTSYTFARLEDMFEFFRGKHINPDYWAEKLGGGRSSVQEFSQTVFRQTVRDHVASDIRFSDAPRGIGKAVKEQILDIEVYDREEAVALLNGFDFHDYTFHDTWEWSFSDYDWEYLWACHAIVWGIAQYDNERRKPAPKQLVETVALPEAVPA